MNASVTTRSGFPAQGRWQGSETWARMADVWAILFAAALPWSTSFTSIFIVLWVLAIIPTFDGKSFVQSLKRPICCLPIAFVVLAVVGTIWSETTWTARFYMIGPASKLLLIPLLIYRYERYEHSARGIWVFLSFLLSCAALMVMSCIVAFHPELALRSGAEYGVPVRNYIDQGQEFSLCVVALVPAIIFALRGGKRLLAVVLAVLLVSFLLNMIFVVVSRTALMTVPVILAILALKRGILIRATLIMAVAAAIAWGFSPRIQAKFDSFMADYRGYSVQNNPTGLGSRLEFWRKSVRFFEERPIFGHGTGSVRGLFERAAVGKVGAVAEVVSNPHNQTLSVAIQWGAIGIVVLYAMWVSHLLLFMGDGLVVGIGFVVVVQNMVTSLLNSHLFDFSPGWIYVLGVGIAGGMANRSNSALACQQVIAVSQATSRA